MSRQSSNRHDPDRTQVVTSVTLSKELHQQLKDAAYERDVSMAYIIKEAIKDFMPRLKPADQFRLTRDEPVEEAPAYLPLTTHDQVRDAWHALDIGQRLRMLNLYDIEKDKVFRTTRRSLVVADIVMERGQQEASTFVRIATKMKDEEQD